MMARWRWLLRLVGILALLTGMAACGGLQQEFGDQPDFVGWVLAVEPAGRRGGGRLVAESQANKIVRRLTVTVAGDAQIYRREGDNMRPIDFGEVAVQDQAQIWLTGPVPRDFPARATARRVIVERFY